MEFRSANPKPTVTRSSRPRSRLNGKLLGGLSALLITLLINGLASAQPSFFAPPFLPAQGSTSPSNGDLVPYGLAVVPRFFPGHTLSPGQLLVSNFNNSAGDGNLPGQGSTIVIIDPASGQQTGVFFQGTQPIGFTNALSILPQGFVIAGSLPTNSMGTSPTSGGLLVLNANGNQITTITDGVNGAWGMAVNQTGGSSAQLFVANVLDGTITRLEVSFGKGSFNEVGTPTTIGSGYAFAPDMAGLVVGPAGLFYETATDRLYVAAEGDNEIFVIKNASKTSNVGKGTLVFSDPSLEGPLGLIIGPNGNLITANADPTHFQNPATPSELVEFTKSGKFVREFSIDPNLGAAFALLNVPVIGANEFSYVDDFTSSITILRVAP